jgi:transcriptional regulator with XRE-family HTH domain
MGSPKLLILVYVKQKSTKIRIFLIFFSENLNMNFWDRVDRLIKQEKTSYAYLAKRLEKRESTVSGWHREGAKHTIPRADFAVIIAKILKTSVEYLVTGEEIKVPGLSPEALEIARAAEKLSAEGKKAALGAVEGLQRVYPLGGSILSSKKA